MIPLRKNLREVIAVAAAALIVGSFAIPAFNGYVERSRVARAVSDIGTMSLQLYRWQRDTNALPENLAQAGLGGVDPWGRPYVYLRAADASRTQLRKDERARPAEHRLRSVQLGPRRRVGAARCPRRRRATTSCAPRTVPTSGSAVNY